ncbi:MULTISPECIES: histidinol-phosphatase [unclassified Pseudomonas]|uniref:histidinol-phosphatase n=1 Tax=unclassified Pseudomonas TaxID=196821 RepID=UPI001686A282|nr:MULTISPECIES: histidinol-phosphatase [unclassified Pseudomonas]QNV67596.1 histidinol-phosphatase [Pseudomonas sp. CFA]HEN8703786.1 histidinol-phosphatase [Pseudomonas putida]MCX2812627.1 histidinol-phosphatase [Pseudomonas sp. DCB_E]MCX9140380.1 histidinol-phosphatase [Pseudomonas sp. DCB_Q]MDH0705137.1 histidinol-phosphatase [Pseudomonas sp. GD03862]
MSLSAEQIVEYRAFAEQLADAAAAAIAPYFRASLDVEDKGGRLYDPVTVADKAAEDAMRELIQARYPEHGILGEEAGIAVGSSPLTWVLDPIDGTRAFITGLPLWGTLIALNDGTQPVVGVMNQPFTGERFVGTPAGAWRSGTPLKTRACTDLSAATLMCTTPDMFDTAERKAAFEAVAGKARLMRYGGDCYAYCMLASGFVDVIVEASLQPYDVQALMPIIEGAGGVITAWDGSSAQDGGCVVACGDPALHAQVLEMLRHAM